MNVILITGTTRWNTWTRSEPKVLTPISLHPPDYKFYLVTHAFAMDMAHQESAFGEYFNKKKSRMIEYIYKMSKKILDKRYGPQQFKGVCKTEEELNHCNSPVLCVCL